MEVPAAKEGWLKKKSNKLGWDTRFFKHIDTYLGYSKTDVPFAMVGR